MHLVKLQYCISSTNGWEVLKSKSSLRGHAKDVFHEKPGKWEDYLHLVKFAFNNNCHVSTCMTPFEILYGCNCNTPISWSISVDRLMLGPDLLQDMELTVKQVQQNLKAS